MMATYCPPLSPTRPKIIACKAAQGMAMEISVAAINLSRLLSRIRVDNTAGTLQPKPNRLGMMAYPCSPRRCRSVSIRMARRGR